MKETITYKDLELKLALRENIEEIKKAYLYAEKEHEGQKRLTGDDLITHILEVTNILLDLNVDDPTIIAALLHETINHGTTTYEKLKENFGEEVAKIVQSVSKINKLELTKDNETDAIYLRKILVGLAEDVRVLFIKLADRLHNMRTNWAIKPENQKKKAEETLKVLVPIAHRLGINSIKSELENLCLYYTKNDVYNDILNKLNESQGVLSESLNSMKESITNILNEQGLKFKIKGRVKSVYSIYKKLNNGKEWKDIYDILALRVILEEEADCYMAMGLVHAKYRPIPKRFKDYIAMPKANMYQSLHTTVIGDDGNFYEIQFRTFEMDEFAEKGMASHWSYKEKGSKKVQNIMEQKLELFRNLIETNEDLSDNDFIEEAKNDVLAEMIYVFTPKGDAVELPQGATPVDFAYRIHSDVGDRTVGAIVNEKIVPLNYELHNNDIVKINTKETAVPNKDWMTFVKTPQAKNKIKSYFSKQDRENLITKGKNIFEKELRKRKLSFAEVMSESNVKKILKDLKLKDVEDIYLSIGTLRYTSGYIISLTETEKENVLDAFLEKTSKITNAKNYKNAIIVAGLEEILVNIANCCKPVKGDDIVGFVTKGQGITVHNKNCINIAEKNERIIDVSWNMNNNSIYFTDLFVETLNDKNYINDIIATFTKRDIHIDSLKTKNYPNSNLYEITVKVQNKDELNKIIRDLEILSYVTNVRRTK